MFREKINMYESGLSELTFSCSKQTTETLEEGVKYFQS